MAGDWIKMRVLIGKDPKVLAMAEFLSTEREFMDWLTDPVRVKCKQSVYEHVMPPVIVGLVVAGLVPVWGIACERGKVDGNDLCLFHARLSSLDNIAGIPAFGEAMESVGWAVAEERSGRKQVRLPDFMLHNVPVEDRQKSKNRERQAKFREKGGGSAEKWTAIRVRILERDDYVCAYCGRKARAVDHVIPLSRGGLTDARNLVACCKRCNSQKKDRCPEEVGMSFWPGFSGFDQKGVMSGVTPSYVISSSEDNNLKEPHEDNKFAGGPPQGDTLGENARSENLGVGAGGGRGKKNSARIAQDGRGPPGERPGFAEFYAAYPRKKGRIAAAKAWQRLDPDAALRAAIMGALERQKGWPGWQDANFIPHPVTWLNGRRWEDVCDPAPVPALFRGLKEFAERGAG